MGQKGRPPSDRASPLHFTVLLHRDVIVSGAGAARPVRMSRDLGDLCSSKLCCVIAGGGSTARRTFCIGTIIVAMLAGSAVGVTGQDEPLSGRVSSLEMHTIEGRHTATLLQDGTVLVVGGTSHGDARPGRRRDLRPGPRRCSPPSNHCRSRRAHGGSRLIAEVENLSLITTRQFSGAGRLKSPRQDHSAILLDDGRVLVVGGMDFTRVVDRSHPSRRSSFSARR